MDGVAILIGILFGAFIMFAAFAPLTDWCVQPANANPADDDTGGATFARFDSTRLVRTAERLTIDKGSDADLRKGMVVSFVLLVVLGGCLISLFVAIDVGNFRRPAVLTFVYGPIVVVPILLLLAQFRDRIVFDRAQGTLRQVRVSLFRTFVRREEPLASVRRARITGAMGASWEFVVELDSGELWRPLLSLETAAYQPDELQKYADLVNEFLQGSQADKAKAELSHDHPQGRNPEADGCAGQACT
jgi:hypothetical protein